jgi:hypothetical protein
LRMVTFPARRILSIYRGVIGRSVESMDIFCFTLLWIDLADKYCDGLLILKGVLALSFSRMIYFENCAADFGAENESAMQTSSKTFFILIV